MLALRYRLSNKVIAFCAILLNSSHGVAVTEHTHNDDVPANYVIEADSAEAARALESNRQLLLVSPESGLETSSATQRSNDPAERVTLGSRFVDKHGLRLPLFGRQRSEDNSAFRQTVDIRFPDKRTIRRYQQQVDGIEIFQHGVTILYDAAGIPLMSSGQISDAVAVKRDSGARGTASPAAMQDAVSAAYRDLSGSTATPILTRTSSRAGYTRFSAQAKSAEYSIAGPARAKPIWYALDSALLPAFYIEIQIERGKTGLFLGFAYIVEHGTNRILLRANQTAHDSSFSYRGFFKDTETATPAQGPHGDVIPKLDPSAPDTRVLAEQSLVTITNWSPSGIADPWLTAETSSAVLESLGVTNEEAGVRTAGNNVVAYADRFPPDGYSEGDFMPRASDEGIFEYTLDRSLDDTSDQNAGAAAVNLFVVSNYLHDWWYQLKIFEGDEAIGFNEQFNNAQFSNYGRGGEEGDPLKVEAQDYGGVNNANMYTPADGASPRMQQFLWDGKYLNGVDFGMRLRSPVATEYVTAKTASFGPRQYEILETEVVLAADIYPLGESSGDDVIWAEQHDGCEEIADPSIVAGKILLLIRGSCNFAVKVLNAQAAGAIGVLVYNNVNDGSPAPMGGSDPDVTIPSMGLSSITGDVIKTFLQNETPVTADMFFTGSMNDSSFDNGIVAHEWGHYMQNRMVGNSSGLINFQGRAMGEGWADFHSMMFLVEKAQSTLSGNGEFQVPYSTGTYVADFYEGIRRAPYTPDMTINPLTFAHIIGNAAPPDLPPTNVGSPHAPGEIWATVLWDLYVDLLNRHEFEEAQNRMALYLFAGYAFTPASPTYTEARDAILYFINNWDAEDYARATEVFARRGMGYGAISPPKNSSLQEGTAITESFSSNVMAARAEVSFVQNLNQIESEQCTANDIFDVGETGWIKVLIHNQGAGPLTHLQVQVSAEQPGRVNFPEGAALKLPEVPSFGSVEAFLPVSLATADVGQTLNFSVAIEDSKSADTVIQNAESDLSIIVNYAGVLRDLIDAADTADMETLATEFDLSVRLPSYLSQDQRGLSAPSRNTINTGFFQAFNPSTDFGAATLFLPNTPFLNDYSVETVPFEVSDSTPLVIRFWHFYWIEEGWDGGVIEISHREDDATWSEWSDVIEAGGLFDVGYPGSITQGLWAERPAFTGINGDLATTAGNAESISFGNAFAGKTVRLRFRMLNDEAVSSFGWNIDNLEIRGANTPVFHDLIAGDVVACDTDPVVTNEPSQPTISNYFYENGKIWLYASTVETVTPDTYTATCKEQKNPLMSVVASSASSPITVSDLKPDTGYVCEVTAVNGAGESIASSPTSTIITTEPAVPSNVIIIRTDYGDGEIYLTVTADDGRREITSYEATCTDGEAVISATSAVPSITVSGLTNGVSYFCTVVAKNVVGASEPSSVSDAVTPEETADGLPIWLLFEAQQQTGP
jgi:hypothetical protein